MTAPDLPSPSPVTILVVEDEEGVRGLVREILVRRGYRVLDTGDPQEARRFLKEADGGPVLLLADLSLPGTTGHRLADALRAGRPDLRVLFMSGYPEDEAGGGLGDPFIQKPFTPGALMARVEEVLAGR